MNIQNDNLDKWAPAARELPDSNQPTLPHHVLMGEAVDVARFFETHWTTQLGKDGSVAVPGLELAARDGLFTQALGREVLELQDATQAAQTHYRFTVSEPNASEMERAEYVLGEIRSTLEFSFDDDIDDADDVRLERLSAAHATPRSQDAMATALDEYAALADQHRERVAGLGGFDATLIDEALTLATSLRERSARRVAGEVTTAQRDALELRNRMATLLYDRMQRIRTAARFVYRNDPDRVRRVTSAYRREQRARYRDAASGVEELAQPSAAVAGE